jgi:hypothetical protein
LWIEDGVVHGVIRKVSTPWYSALAPDTEPSRSAAAAAILVLVNMSWSFCSLVAVTRHLMSTT